MWLILIFLVAGTLGGLMLRKVRRFSSSTDKISTWLIYILLFIMGLLVGSDNEIMDHIGAIGTQAITIALFAVFGSILLSGITYKLFFKNEK